MARDYEFFGGLRATHLTGRKSELHFTIKRFVIFLNFHLRIRNKTSQPIGGVAFHFLDILGVFSEIPNIRTLPKYFKTQILFS